MNTVTVLADHGIQRPAEVIELAARAGLELAAAATLLQKESGGGKNIYGHDAVDTGGFYVKGGPVTKANFTDYKKHRKQLGAQGVGPTQLTLPAFQDRADARGGCWDWKVNALVGFEILAGLVTAHGVHDGFRAYNGSGPAAERYADDAVVKLSAWRQRLQGAMSGMIGVHRPTLREGDVGPVVASVQRFMNATFPLYSHIDLAPHRYGPQTVRVVAEFQRRAGVHGHDVDPAGRMIAGPTWGALEHFGFH
jgi:hypothetical protein